MSAGDLYDALEEVSAKVDRMERVIGQVVSALDEYPAALADALDGHMNDKFTERSDAEALMGELGKLLTDRPGIYDNGETGASRLGLLVQGWAQNPNMTLTEVADALEAKVFGILKDAGVPADKAEEVAGTVAQKVEAALGAGDDRAAQEEANAQGILSRPGKLVSKSILSKLRDQVAPGAGRPGSTSPLTRGVEVGGKPVVRAVGQGFEAQSTVPPKDTRDPRRRK